MTSPDLGSIIRRYEDAYKEVYGLSAQQSKVLGSIKACRTARLGGHMQVCDSCGVVRVWYNSCRDRHCPKCQFYAKEKWLAARRAELLPVKYFHIVFTIPAVLHEVFRHNERLCYDLLFSTAWSSLKSLCSDTKYLGALPGMLAVLHTWGQNLHYHPHVHGLVPAGGLSFDRSGWQASKHKSYLVSVRALSRLFRGRLVSELGKAWRANTLSLPRGFPMLKTLDEAMSKEWVVYAKKPFGKANKLLDYLGRYLKRVAISNERLLKDDGTKVDFAYRDYADGNKRKLMSLQGVEFMRRFVQHILPWGFCNVRYYGILSNRYRQRTVALCQYLLRQSYHALKDVTTRLNQLQDQAQKCPHCQQGKWKSIAWDLPIRAPPNKEKDVPLNDKAVL